MEIPKRSRRARIPSTMKMNLLELNQRITKELPIPKTWQTSGDPKETDFKAATTSTLRMTLRSNGSTASAEKVRSTSSGLSNSNMCKSSNLLAEADSTTGTRIQSSSFFRWLKF